MTQAMVELQNWGFRRKTELLEFVYAKTSGKVYQGPFNGMSVVNKFMWGVGDTCGQLLGLYECELHPSVEKMLLTNPDLCINIGCAEGHYGLGMALRKPDMLTVLMDINPAAMPICQENAELNGITSNVEYTTKCGAEDLRNYLSKYDRPCMIMDIEGHEKVLLDLNVVPELSKCTILVETHDCFVPNITNILCERFSDTHTIEIISQGAKNPYIDILFELPDTDKMVLCCETRPQTSYWLFLVPKSLESIK
jgi:hypothetical protein